MAPDTDHRPLAGVRVLDLTRVLAGPYCTMILADLGAEVVKIERPDVGDDARHFGPFLPSGNSGYFASINRGKKSVVLDLKSDFGKETFRKLVARADVLVENFRPGTLDRLGFDEATLHAINPGLVIAAASGFGRAGTYGPLAAYDIIIQAMSGLMSVTGTDAAHPVRVGSSIGDILTGMFTAIGILASLRVRERDGKGPTLDIAMLDSVVAVMENALARCAVTGESPGPIGTRHPSITPFQAFETADTPLVLAAGNDVLWGKLCEAIGAPELAEDSRFSTNHDRCEKPGALEPLLQEKMRERGREEWLAIIGDAGIPCAAIRNMAEVMQDEHLIARGMFHHIDDGSGTFVTAASPVRMNDAPMPLSPHVPALGEHTEQVLGEWLGDG